MVFLVPSPTTSLEVELSPSIKMKGEQEDKVVEKEIEAINGINNFLSFIYLLSFLFGFK